MTVQVWPPGDAALELGEKAQGLITLARLGLPVPSALILRGDQLAPSAGLSVEQRVARSISAILRWHAARPRPQRAVSLRCATKGRRDGRRLLPESVLALGIAEAPEDAGASRAVCQAHADAFFAFFDRQAPERFADWPIERQLHTLLPPLLGHMDAEPVFLDGSRRTLVVQQMVYGDRDARSLTGVAYTRNPRTGALVDYGHLIVGRQGMALGGVDDPRQRDLSEMASINPTAYATLNAAFRRLEAHHLQVRQIEFTAEGEALFLLQNTSGNYDVPLEASCLT